MFTIKKCAQCGKKIGRLDFSYSCSNCGRVLCSDCIKKVKYESGDIKEYYGVNYTRPDFSWTKMSNVLCPQCAGQFNVNQKRVKYAIATSENVELVSINYRGRKNSGIKIKRVSSGWYRDRAECDIELQKRARLAGGNKVINVTTERETREEQSNTSRNGIHKYTVYRRQGDVVL